MSAQPAVSVVIPCFNAEGFLERAVRSVLDQGVVETEIVIVDDCSGDNTVAVAERLAREHAKIQVVRRPTNGGPAAARNSGLRVSRGKYICFLDADDEYLPGFFQAALGMLERDPATAAFLCYVELANCTREVHPVQLIAVANTLPSNLMARRTVCELVGGFSEDPRFRGPAAGEDFAFRFALDKFFNTHREDRPYLRYYVQPASHFDRFLDRTVVEGGKLRFKFDDPADGTVTAARFRYIKEVQHRLEASYHLKCSLRTAAIQAVHDIESTAQYEQLRNRFEDVQGWLTPPEGYALYRWAMTGPGTGVVVEVGSFMGRSTCWLAQGTADAKREKVFAVDHFRGSPGHQQGQWAEVAEIVKYGTTLPQFQANIARMGLSDWVEPRIGSSEQIAADWSQSVRLLFIDGEHSLEASQRDLEAWSQFVHRDGCIALHDVGVYPGVTELYETLLQRNQHLYEVCSVNSLRIFRMNQPAG